MVIESAVHVGPNSLKGCLQLEDLAPLIPNPDAFLSDRGLKKVDFTKLDYDEDSEDNEMFSFSEESSEESEEHIRDEPNDTNFVAFATKAEEAKEEKSADQKLNQNDIEPKATSEDDSSVEEDKGSSGNEREQGGVAIKSVSVNDAVSLDDEEEISSDEMIDQVFDDEDGNSLSSGSDKAVIVLHSVSQNSEDSQIDDESIQVEASEEELLEETSLEETTNVEPEKETKSMINDELFASLVGEVESILGSYTKDRPSALSDLNILIESRDYQLLCEEIKTIWSRLLKYHQKKNTRLPPKVVYAFNQINSRLRRK
jgi:hypothetical protein